MTRQEQIDERHAVALERIADTLDKIDGHLFVLADHACDPEWPDDLRRIARCAEHAQGLPLDPPWGKR